MKISIISKVFNSVLFEHEAENNSMKLTLESAVKADADLFFASLQGENLVDADLSGGDFYNVNFAYANLVGANFQNSKIVDAAFYGANLCGANFSGADIKGFDFTGSNLHGANFISATLDGELLSKPPLYLDNLTLPILITDSYLSIEFERHLIEHWRGLSEDDMYDMDIAASFWKKWKTPILALCDAKNAP
jgi:uncharacterized protein YjbI with pentapeptide repeats